MSEAKKQKKVSNAPPPISPLRGFYSRPSRKPMPARWNVWKFIPKCQLWEAVCLTLDIEPDDEKHGITLWLMIKPRDGLPFGLSSDFADRLKILEANVGARGPIYPQGMSSAVPSGPHGEVLLSEIAAFAIQCGWDIPEVMRTFALRFTPVEEPQSLTQTAQNGVPTREEWLVSVQHGDEERQKPAFRKEYERICSLYDERDDLKRKNLENGPFRDKKIYARLAEISAELENTNGIANKRPEKFSTTDSIHAETVTSNIDTSPVNKRASWGLKKVMRYPGYRKPLYDVLKAAHAAGLPCPTARDVLAAFAENKPPGIIKVMFDSIDYLDAIGDSATADLKAISQAIDRLVTR